jgi:hypothetical protein
MIVLSQSVSDLFLLIMLRVIAVLSRDKNKPAKFRVSELSMTAFSAVDSAEAGAFQIGNQLADFARHTKENAREVVSFPVSVCCAFFLWKIFLNTGAGAVVAP